MSRLPWLSAASTQTPLTNRYPTYPAATRVEQCLDLVFPPVCAGCRRIGRWICARCWFEMPWMHDWTCGQCGRLSATPLCDDCQPGKSPLDRIISVAAFEGPARDAIHAFKFHGLHAMSSAMGRIMANCAATLEVNAVVHVPLHRSRRRERGYDQSSLLARSVARQLDLPWNTRALARTRRTEQQALLSADERTENVAGAFAARSNWQGERLLLIDDVCTTGATLKAAAAALQESGAGEIIGLVFAKAL